MNLFAAVMISLSIMSAETLALAAPFFADASEEPIANVSRTELDELVTAPDQFLGKLPAEIVDVAKHPCMRTSYDFLAGVALDSSIHLKAYELSADTVQIVISGAADKIGESSLEYVIEYSRAIEAVTHWSTLEFVDHSSSERSAIASPTCRQ